MIIGSGPTGGNFFAAVKSFDAYIAISSNFVLNTKNSIVPRIFVQAMVSPTVQCLPHVSQNHLVKSSSKSSSKCQNDEDDENDEMVLKKR